MVIGLIKPKESEVNKMSITEKYEKYAEFVSDIENCDECFGVQETRILLGRGDINPDILFVGIGPKETYAGRGMVFGPYSRSGKIFNRLLESIKIRQNQEETNKKGFTYWVTNCVKCSYPEKRLIGDITACPAIWFGMEIPLLNPKIIVFFSSPVAKQVLKRKFRHLDTFTWNIRGSDAYTYNCILSYHPKVWKKDHDWNDENNLQEFGRTVASLLQSGEIQ